jgi:1,4-alpha-glucan branching enzyme
MTQGYLAIILHAHLPLVRHPEQPSFLEEEWLFEAITESYLPLISMLSQIAADQVPCRLTLSISPTLAEMLNDPLLQSRYLDYLSLRIELTKKEIIRTKRFPQFLPLARMYWTLYSRARRTFEEHYGRNLLKAFGALQQQGIVELITCPATHPFIPFVSRPEVKRAQLAVALATHQSYFGSRPRGIWLAECGYVPEMDQLLKELGLEYHLLDAHGVLLGTPRPRYGIYSPVLTPRGLAVFGRDMESSWQVWNLHGGYPGDFSYREFYRDLGYDAEYEYIKPYLSPTDVRRNLGIKYYRITGKGDLGAREPYGRRMALVRVREHASHFVSCRQSQIAMLSKRLKRPPLVVAPYDAELFGHWWFEGPQFLNLLIRKAAARANNFQLVTLGDYLDTEPEIPCSQPSASSWGAEGYNRTWLNSDTQWLYRHQHWAEDRMVELANSFPDIDGDLERMLNQAGRELLLAQSSDWAFGISRRTFPLYAIRRFREHISRFQILTDQILNGQPDMTWVQMIERRDNLFPHMNYRVFQSRPSSYLGLTQPNGK